MPITQAVFIVIFVFIIGVHCKNLENTDATEDENKPRANITCGENLCEEYQKCTFEVSTGENYCSCPKGKSGPLCETIDECVTGKLTDCKNGNGNCKYEKDKETAYCDCGDRKEWDPLKMKCLMPCNDDCHHNGTCENVLGNRFCSCKKGTSGDLCETVNYCTRNVCKKSTGQKCVYDEAKGGGVCKCNDPNKLYDRNSGRCRIPCRKHDDCQSFEKCRVFFSGENFCYCPRGKSGEQCENVNDCITGKFKSCKGGNGHCMFNDEKEAAECDCGVDKIWDYNQNLCRKICKDDCVNNGDCWKQGNVSLCVCKEGTEGDLCEKVKDCSTGMRYCGLNNDVKCFYDESTYGGKCVCDNSSKLFDFDEKRCRVPCKDDCHNNGKCEYVRGFRFCSCKKGISGDFCETVDDCTKKDICGTLKEVKCVYNKTTEGGTCICVDTHKFFDTDAKMCRTHCDTHDDCQTFERCTQLPSGVSYCSCPPGKSGSRCEVIDECVEGQFKMCKDENGHCKYNDEKGSAECDCGRKKWDVAERRCRAPCRNIHDCENDADCIKVYGNDDSFCDCRSGTSGDRCETVNDCAIVGFCGFKTDVRCVYDGEEDGKCECEDPNKLFDPEAKECRTPCFYNCKNKGICKNFGPHNFCRCKSGVSGDLCDNVDDCAKEHFCPKVTGLKCAYDGIKGGICKCENSTKKFDHVEKECRIPCKGGCANQGECEVVGEDMFCRCKPGTRGDICTISDDCAKQDYCGTKDDVKCVLSENMKSGVCKCDDPTKYFDPKKKECRRSICADDECQNGGICVGGVKEMAKCYCSIPFSGERCEKGPCTDNPCRNGGTCKIEGNIYTCLCREQFFGKTCEVANRLITTSGLVLLILLVVLVFSMIICGGCCMFKMNQKLKRDSNTCRAASSMP